MSKAEVRRWWKTRELELRDLVWEWDPLGLRGAPADEYDCVVDALLSRLVADGSRSALVAALDDQTAHFGAPLARPAERAAFADRILQWWSHAPAPPPVE